MYAENSTRAFSLTVSSDPLFPSCLVLTDATDQYLALRGWDHSALGREIGNLYNYCDAVAIGEIFRKLEIYRDGLTFFRELFGSVWCISARRFGGSVRFDASADNTEGLCRRCQELRLSRVSGELLRRSFVDTLLLRDGNDGVTVESVCDSVSRFTGLSRGGRAGIARSFLYCIDPETAVRACLDAGCPVRYPDIYTRGGNRKYLLLQFSPMLHHDRLAAVSVHLLREDEYYSLQLPYWGLPLPSADSSCAAYAIFGFDGASFSLHSCSSSFPQLSGTDAEQLSARLLLPCRSSDALRCGFQNLGGTRYLCAAAPRPDGSVHTAILKFDEIQAGIENSLCILSPREREITGYVVDGLSAREISQRLLIAEGTVKKTVSNIYSKLDVSSKVDLIHRVLQY